MEIDSKLRARLDQIAQHLRDHPEIENFDYYSLRDLSAHFDRDGYNALMELYPTLGVKAYIGTLTFLDMIEKIEAASPKMYFEMNKFRPIYVAELKEYLLIAERILNEPVRFQVTPDFSVDGTMSYIITDHSLDQRNLGNPEDFTTSEQFEQNYPSGENSSALLLAEDLMARGGIMEFGLHVIVPLSDFNIDYFYGLLEDAGEDGEIGDITYYKLGFNISFRLTDSTEQRRAYEKEISDDSRDSDSDVIIQVGYYGLGPYTVEG